MTARSFLLYGANGYTGSLIARQAVERGLRPVLAGRNRAAVAALADALGCEWRAFALEDTAALDAALAGVEVMLHCAGPFAHTSRLGADACLRTQTHYLDITGEVAVFEALAQRDAQARAAGIMLLPGAGFDVVPSDCLAAHLKRRLPGAQRLTLAFQALGGVSRGTATTAIESLGHSGLIRRDSRLVATPGVTTRSIDFGDGPVSAVRIAWGDVSTAFHSTGIPNIEVYAALSRSARMLMAAGGLARAPLVQRVLKRLVRSLPAGPSDSERARGLSLLWGEAEDAAGRRSAARLRTPESYTLTAQTALAIVEQVLSGHAPAGFQTPSCAYGADFILGFPGVTRTDLA